MDTNNQNTFADIICKQLGLPAKGVAGTVELLDEGCTIPFISRYRKERTGGLDEVQIAAIADLKARLSEMAKRKETIVKAITDQGKMTPELSKRIGDCWAAAELEDIYLPYKPKRRTRAQVAREQGLEPLAAIVMAQRERDIERVAARFAKGGVADAAAALKGAQDIIAEGVSEDERTRNAARAAFRRGATIVSKAVKGKADTDEAVLQGHHTIGDVGIVLGRAALDEIEDDADGIEDKDNDEELQHHEGGLARSSHVRILLED